jgi:hypothetical protein
LIGIPNSHHPQRLGFFEVFDIHGTGNVDPEEVAVIEKLRSG